MKQTRQTPRIVHAPMNAFVFDANSRTQVHVHSNAPHAGWAVTAVMRAGTEPNSPVLGAWRCHRKFNDPFRAVDEAWRWAMVLRAIRHSPEVAEVCREVLEAEPFDWSTLDAKAVDATVSNFLQQQAALRESGHKRK